MHSMIGVCIHCQVYQLKISQMKHGENKIFVHDVTETHFNFPAGLFPFLGYVCPSIKPFDKDEHLLKKDSLCLKLTNCKWEVIFTGCFLTRENTRNNSDEEHLITEIRPRFWIVKCRQAARSAVEHFIKCWRTSNMSQFLNHDCSNPSSIR